MNFKQRIVKRYRISRIHNTLKQLPDRTLSDIGYSPELIRMGRAKYPWKSKD